MKKERKPTTKLLILIYVGMYIVGRIIAWGVSHWAYRIGLMPLIPLDGYLEFVLPFGGQTMSSRK